MGQVWQATDTQLNRQVALKLLPDAFADDPDRLARFQREAQVPASLNHPKDRRGGIMRWMLFVSLLISVPAAAAAQTTTAAMPRTPWGAPDLQGIWDNRTITPLERPRQFTDRATLTAAEAAAYEASTAESRVDDRYYWDRGTRTVDDRRTALVVDPADGRVPPLTPEGQRRFEIGRRQGVNGPDERNPTERCITRSLPRLPGLYNNNFQIFQTPDYAVILMEMIHAARIVPLDRRPPLVDHVRQWNGDSRGHWEGDTLVIETTHFTSKTNFRGSTDRLRLVERLTRVSTDTIDYRFTVSDPTTWAQPWTAQIPLNQNDGPLYEYACHEGNDGMSGILTVNRNIEQER